MGYTHYFRQNEQVSQEQWNEFQKDAEVLITFAQTDLGIVLISNDKNGVIINNERINLNGDESKGLDHETFYLSQDDGSFNFCKTAYKPYDLVVCSLLLLADHYMRGCYEISSDGGLEGWKDSMKLNAKLFGYGFELPKTVDNSEGVEIFENSLFKEFVATDINNKSSQLNEEIKTENSQLKY